MGQWHRMKDECGTQIFFLFLVFVFSFVLYDFFTLNLCLNKIFKQNNNKTVIFGQLYVKQVYRVFKCVVCVKSSLCIWLKLQIPMILIAFEYFFLKCLWDRIQYLES
eukprot:TRINITY_DN9876_c0_g1_i1.p5 TRINITY_DN9876_c0_g1~~TRINITY_DN9876_c0_g1_i1.p5  ORF type:complete len:107 (-),score=4.47 TRINITY_DN9876_c0_g1_i1:232-552(-)